MKSGENEAKRVLERIGAKFDEHYCDDNTSRGMPDFRYVDGRFLEVTHTFHNHQNMTAPNQYQLKPLDVKFQIELDAAEAYQRIREDRYPYDDSYELTPEGKQQLKRDIKTVRNHYGIDLRDGTHHEECCDIPVVHESADNVLREVREKGRIHFGKDIDLFIYVTEGELNSVLFYIKTKEQNGCAIEFLREIYYSPFKRIFLCEWNLQKQEYVATPMLITFESREDQKSDIRITR